MALNAVAGKILDVFFQMLFLVTSGLSYSCLLLGTNVTMTKQFLPMNLCPKSIICKVASSFVLASCDSVSLTLFLIFFCENNSLRFFNEIWINFCNFSFHFDFAKLCLRRSHQNISYPIFRMNQRNTFRSSKTTS